MPGPGGKPTVPLRATLRLDKWLWQARLFKARSLAALEVEEGHFRVNGQPTRKPGYAVGAGDVLTFPLGGRIRLIRILAIGFRRGPASEAESLYLDLDLPQSPPEVPTPLE